MISVDKPLISIIVPVYKVEPYIDKCIQSILKQTYNNLQIILVDDASPDNSGKICDKYALMDNRIEVIHKSSNTGLSDARNIGISKAKGKYIGFVDSDDYINEEMYEDMYNLIEKKEADICMCNFYNVIDDTKSIKNEDNGIEEYNKIQILKETLLDRKIQSYAWNKLYKRELFDEIQYPVGKKYEDIGTTFYILEKCNKIIVSGKPEYYYLNRKDSIVNNNNEQTIMDYINIIDERYNYIEKKYNELGRYNMYYLAKTLITAYSDIYNLKHTGKEINEKLELLHKKIKKIMKEHEEEIINLFDEKQKMQLYTLLYNPDLYNYLIKGITKED